jgi:hypothetical protein
VFEDGRKVIIALETMFKSAVILLKDPIFFEENLDQGWFYLIK